MPDRDRTAPSILRQVAVVDRSEPARRAIERYVDRIPRVIVHGFGDLDAAIAWAAENYVDAFVLSNVAQPAGTERLRALSAFAETPIVTVAILPAPGERSATFVAGANDVIPWPVGPDEFAARLARLLDLACGRRDALRDRESLERLLLEEQRRGREHSARIDALWRIANGSGLSHEELLHSMLAEGTYAIGSGDPFCGAISHREGDELVVDAQAYDPLPQAVRETIMKVGERVPFEQTLQFEVSRFGITRAWDDLSADASIRIDNGAVATGWRSAISTEFRAGGVTYYLAFLSKDVVRPFTADDHAYVELLATFFASKLEQKWQWDRISYQTTHDTLTGLFNRSNFRSQVHTRLAEPGAHALVTININEFHQVNQTYGHQTGDALLVEVAAGLLETRSDDEVVGRLAGDTFVAFIPAAGNVRARADAYMRAFERPFSTGDRDGRAFVGLSARAGVALAPADGTSFDELILRADAMTKIAKARKLRISFSGDLGAPAT